MKRIFFALMAVAAIAMTGSFAGCKSKGEPDPDENAPRRFDSTQFDFDITPPYPTIPPAPLRISEAE